MKNKLLLATLILSTTITLISCSSNSTKEKSKTLSSVVLDQNSKNTVTSDSKLNITMIGKSICNEPYLYSRGKLLFYPEGTTNNTQIISYKIGTISDKKDPSTNYNVIDLDDNNYSFSSIASSVEMDTIHIKDNKGYQLTDNNSFKEIKSFSTLLSKSSDIIEEYMSFNKNIYTFIVNNKLALIDTTTDKYYEISTEAFKEVPSLSYTPAKIYLDNINHTRSSLDNTIFTDKSNKIFICGIDGERIYVAIETLVKNKKSTMFGYIENDKFTTILSNKDGINITDCNKAIYYKNKILFEGIVNDNLGIWNYDINNKKLSKQFDLDNSVKNHYFTLSPNNDKIMITSSDDTGTQTCILANLNDNFQISNVTPITSPINGEFYSWSIDGSKFYLGYIDNNNTNNFKSTIEVYTVE